VNLIAKGATATTVAPASLARWALGGSTPGSTASQRASGQPKHAVALKGPSSEFWHWMKTGAETAAQRQNTRIGVYASNSDLMSRAK